MSSDENGGNIARHMSCSRKRTREFGQEESEQLPRGSCGSGPCSCGDTSAKIACKAACPIPPAPAPCPIVMAQARQVPAGASVSMARCTFLPSQDPAQSKEVAAVASCPSTPTFVVHKALPLPDELKSLSTDELMALSRKLDEEESDLKQQLRAHQARYIERFAPPHDGGCGVGLPATDAAAEEQKPGTQPRGQTSPGYQSPTYPRPKPPLLTHPQPSSSLLGPTSPRGCDYRPLPLTAFPAPSQPAPRPLAPPTATFTQHLIPYQGPALSRDSRQPMGAPSRAPARPPLPPPPPRPPHSHPSGIIRGPARIFALGPAPTAAARSVTRPPPVAVNLIRMAMPPPSLLPCGVGGLGGIGRQAIIVGPPARVRASSATAVRMSGGSMSAQVQVVGPGGGGGGGLAPSPPPAPPPAQHQITAPAPAAPKCPPAPAAPLPSRPATAMPAPPPPCGAFISAPAMPYPVGLRAMIPHTQQPRVATVMPAGHLGPGGSLVTLGGGVFRLGMRSVMRLQQEARPVLAGQVQQSMVLGPPTLAARHTPAALPSAGISGGGV